METWVWHLATPLEGQVDAEGIDSRYGVAAVVYSEGGGATSQFRCVAGVVLPCLQVLLPHDDPKQRQPDITLAKEKLGWEPTIELEEGLQYIDKR